MKAKLKMKTSLIKNARTEKPAKWNVEKVKDEVVQSQLYPQCNKRHFEKIL